MSEITARERIHQEVYEAYQAGIDHNQVPFKYPPMKQEDIAEVADDIIDIVREAMLSEEAVEATEKVIHSLDPEVTISETDHWYHAYYGIADALDAAFGPDKETE